jgi:hypothetical protein
MKFLGNIYGNRFQIYHLKDKTYRDAQLGKLVHSITVEHASKHKVVCGSKSTGEKHKEGETAADQQSPRIPSSCTKCQSSLRHFPRNYYKSSPQRFVVGGTMILDARVG